MGAQLFTCACVLPCQDAGRDAGLPCPSKSTSASRAPASIQAVPRARAAHVQHAATRKHAAEGRAGLGPQAEVARRRSGDAACSTHLLLQVLDDAGVVTRPLIAGRPVDVTLEHLRRGARCGGGRVSGLVGAPVCGAAGDAAQKPPLPALPHLDGREAADAKLVLGIVVLLCGGINLRGRTQGRGSVSAPRAAAGAPCNSAAPRRRPHLGEHDFRVVILERGGRLLPVGLQVLAVAAPGGVELRAEGAGAGRMSGGHDPGPPRGGGADPPPLHSQVAPSPAPPALPSCPHLCHHEGVLLHEGLELLEAARDGHHVRGGAGACRRCKQRTERDQSSGAHAHGRATLQYGKGRLPWQNRGPGAVWRAGKHL